MIVKLEERQISAGGRRPLRILIAGLNYAPEPIGIGPYTADMARWLAQRGHEVEVIAAKPYYPDWRVLPAFRGWSGARVEDGVRVNRRPLYVPASPGGIKRVLHHLSFLASTWLPLVGAARRKRPDVVLTIAPSLIAAPAARAAARAARAPGWLHVQDFEVGAALATGLLKSGSAGARAATVFERAAMAGFDQYSSISPQMCARLQQTVESNSPVFELRNWADIDAVTPLQRPSRYRDEWNIMTQHVALYSGNIANKQGVNIIVDAARMLADRGDLTFVICGEGPTRGLLERRAAGLRNVLFRPLQPRDSLGELMGLATVHLLPQLSGAADLVLPSKMTNMLASGRPIVATAEPGTGIAQEVEGCGLIVAPGDASAFAAAIASLCDDPEHSAVLGTAARTRAKERWSRDMVLGRFEAKLLQLAEAGVASHAGRRVTA